MRTLSIVMRSGLGRLRGQRSIRWYVKHGLRIGQGCDLQYPFELDGSHCWLIEIGEEVVFAPGVQVIAHDASTKRFTDYTRIAPVRIGNRVFVGARTLILPGVTIGDDVIIGAGSVVTRDVPAGTVASGSPARVQGSLEDFRSRIDKRFYDAPRFDRSWTVAGGITKIMKAEMIARITRGEGYVQ